MVKPKRIRRGRSWKIYLGAINTMLNDNYVSKCLTNSASEYMGHLKITGDEIIKLCTKNPINKTPEMDL